MKEATGELNMTVVTVVAIAAVAAFFYAFVWPGIRNSIQANTYCAMAQCSECTPDGSGTTRCNQCVAEEDGTEVWSGTCTFKDGSTGGAGGSGGVTPP